MSSLGLNAHLCDFQGVSTRMRLVFEKVAPRETVTIEVTTIDYKAPTPDAYFSPMALVKVR